MSTTLASIPDGYGGLTFRVPLPGGANADIPMTHDGALAVCSSILRAAGVTSAARSLSSTTSTTLCAHSRLSCRCCRVSFCSLSASSSTSRSPAPRNRSFVGGKDSSLSRTLSCRICATAARTRALQSVSTPPYKLPAGASAGRHSKLAMAIFFDVRRGRRRARFSFFGAAAPPRAALDARKFAKINKLPEGRGGNGRWRTHLQPVSHAAHDRRRRMELLAQPRAAGYGGSTFSLAALRKRQTAGCLLR